MMVVLCWKGVYLVREPQKTLSALVSFLSGERLAVTSVGDVANRLSLAFGPVRDH